MASNSLPYVILVAAVLLVVVAPFWISMDAAMHGITQTDTWNQSDNFNESRYGENVDANYRDTAENLWYYSRVAILMGIGITALIAGRRAA